MFLIRGYLSWVWKHLNDKYNHIKMRETENTWSYHIRWQLELDTTFYEGGDTCIYNSYLSVSILHVLGIRSHPIQSFCWFWWDFSNAKLMTNKIYLYMYQFRKAEYGWSNYKTMFDYNFNRHHLQCNPGITFNLFSLST